MQACTREVPESMFTFPRYSLPIVCRSGLLSPPRKSDDTTWPVGKRGSTRVELAITMTRDEAARTPLTLGHLLIFAEWLVFFFAPAGSTWKKNAKASLYDDLGIDP